MKHNGPEIVDAELTNLEMLGLLASRIIHDLKNKLAVISGHAQFAEIAKQNPKVLSEAMAIIKRVSEESGKHVETLAKLRRALPSENGESTPAQVVAVLQELLQPRSGWTLQAPPAAVTGKAAIKPRWLRFLLRSFLTACQAADGKVTMDQSLGEVPLGGADVTPSNPEKSFLRIRIWCRNCNMPDVTKDPAAQFRILAVFELLRRLEGGLVQQASPDGQEEITILIPFVSSTIPSQ